MISSVYCSLSTLNIYKLCNSHSMERKSMLFIMNWPHTLLLRPFKFFFQQLHWFLQLQSCVVKWYKKKTKPWSFTSIMEVDMKFWITLCIKYSCKMFTFCDVVHETKQKNVNKFSSVHSKDWISSLIIKVDIAALF